MKVKDIVKELLKLDQELPVLVLMDATDGEVYEKVTSLIVTQFEDRSPLGYQIVEDLTIDRKRKKKQSIKAVTFDYL